MSLEATLEELKKGKITSCSDLSSYCFTGLSFFFDGKPSPPKGAGEFRLAA